MVLVVQAHSTKSHMGVWTQLLRPFVFDYVPLNIKTLMKPCTICAKMAQCENIKLEFE